MDKATLLNHLKVIQSVYATGLTLWGLLCTLDEQTIKRNRIILKEDGIDIVPPGRTLYIPPNMGIYNVQLGGPLQWNIGHASLEFSKMLLRNFTNDSFEIVHNYCEESDQLDKLRSQLWYHFARLVRNALTHNQRWLLSRPSDLRILPVTWHGKVIEATMNGNEMTFEFYDWFDGMELWEEMYVFGESLY